MAAWRRGSCGTSSPSPRSCTSAGPRSGSGSPSRRCRGRSPSSNGGSGWRCWSATSRARHADRGRRGAAAARVGQPSTRSTPPTAAPAAPPSPATGRPGLVLVTKAGASSELLAKLLDAYAAEPGAVAVDVLLCGIGEQERLLRDGRADVALLHRPFDSTVGFDTEELCTEGQVVVLPAGHPLTGRADVRMADVTALPDLPLPRWPGPDGTYPDGPGPEVRDHAQLFQLIALGRASAVLPESCRDPAAPTTSSPCRSLDAPTVTTVIAWPPHSRSRAVAGLVRTATLGLVVASGVGTGMIDVSVT